MQITWNTGEFTFDLFLPHQLFYLIDRRGARIPGRLRVIAAEILHHLAKAEIGHIGQMRRGMTGIDRRESGPLDNGHRHSSFFQQITGR